jgi:hypothetical protein
MFPEPDEAGGRILYMFIMPPGTNPPAGLDGAHGDDWDYDFPADTDWMWFGWVRYGPLDLITKTFGHELVESISNPEPDGAAWTMNRSLNGGNEIGDACNNTVDVLDGMDMQAYWSQAFRACALPLGSGRPEVQSLSQTEGPITGNTSVVIKGRLFVNVSSVKFGIARASYKVDSPFQITAFSPASDVAGTANVTVTTPFGDSLDSAQFSYGPIVTSINPTSGSILGGQGVTVYGAGLNIPGTQTTITFGDIESPHVYCYDSTRCSAEVPRSNVAGTVDIRVSAGRGGESQPTAADKYTYTGPTITKITPAIVPEDGGVRVDIYGSSLADYMTWKLGDTPVKTVGCFTATSCELYTPPGKGVVNISVEFNGMKSVTQITYAPFPTVYGVVPAKGLATGGTAVTIIGKNFPATQGTTRIKFGSGDATNVQCTAAQCTAVTPSGSSIVDVTVTVNGNLTSLPGPTARFNYIPVITGVTPNSGPATGGTKVTITGVGFASTQFASNASVSFDTTSALNGGSCGATTCEAISPAGSGVVDVHVSLDGQTSQAGAADRFTYDNATIARGWTEWHMQPTGIEVQGGAVAYDTLRKQLLYLAWQWPDGAQTWTWDAGSQNWTPHASASSPQLVNPAMAFDEARGVMVLFGGRMRIGTQDPPKFRITNTTLIWDGTNWTGATPAVQPPARHSAAMAYDPTRRKIVLFGGCVDVGAGCATKLNDTWTWDGITWKQESPNASPAGRGGAAMALDLISGNIMLFGGETAAGMAADQWLWDGAGWVESRPPEAGPGPRKGAGLAYSRLDSGLVLFGGTTNTAYLNDTWIWNGIRWTQIQPTTAPPGGAVIGAAYDSVRDAVVFVIDNAVWTWGGR